MLFKFFYGVFPKLYVIKYKSFLIMSSLIKRFLIANNYFKVFIGYIGSDSTHVHLPKNRCVAIKFYDDPFDAENFWHSVYLMRKIKDQLIFDPAKRRHIIEVFDL